MKTFEEMLSLNVNEKTEKKGNLTYLSWAWAWAEFKKAYPTATYEIERFENNLPFVKADGVGYMVFTKVTVDEITYEMWLPVMDNRNNAILEPDMMDINKAIMRCLTKNLAMFGLGLYIYAGEDLPEAPFRPATDAQINEMTELGINITNAFKYAKVNKWEEMSEEVAQKIIDMKKGIKNAN